MMSTPHHTTSNQHLTHPKYRADIDGLRAIAVLAVVAFHAFPNGLKGGFIGVDIFFVISGFLISTIIIGSLERGSFSFVEFYARRIKRIFPALLLVLTACFVFGWFALLADEYKQLGKHIAGGAGFVANFMFWQESGYFDNAADTKPLLHLWSLGIEEQFYIVWPLLLWLAWKRKFNLLTITLVVALISFALNISKVHSDAVAAFYSPQTRFWELLAGSVLAQMTLHRTKLLPNLQHRLDGWLGQIIYTPAPEVNGKTLRNLQALLGLALILIGFIVVNKERLFPGGWAVLPVLGAVLIITAGAQAWLNRVVLSSRILVWFGLISFPLYLWHWPLLSFARIIESETPTRGIRLAAVALAILLAWLTYWLIEKPLRFGKQGRLKTIVLLVLMGVVGFAGYNDFKRDGLSFRPIAKKSLDFIYQTDNIGYRLCTDEDLLRGVTLNYCLISPKGQINAAIIGDSHADDKFHGISKRDKNRNWMLIGNSSCPPVLGISVEGDQKGCQEKFENIINWLVKSENIKTVALSFYGNYILTTPYAADHVQNRLAYESIKISVENSVGETRAEIFYNGLENAVSALEKGGKKVILAIDVPELPFFPRDCYRRSLSKKCELLRSQVDQRQAKQRVLVARLKHAHPTLVIFDPLDILCTNNLCSYQNSEHVLYRDSHHLSLGGSDYYGKSFLEWIDSH